MGDPELFGPPNRPLRKQEAPLSCYLGWRRKWSIHAVLDRNNLVHHQGRPRHRAQGTPLSAGAAPNDLWCADSKGEFRLGNGQYCYPLTVTDHAQYG